MTSTEDGGFRYGGQHFKVSGIGLVEAVRRGSMKQREAILMNSQKAVTPAKAGGQLFCNQLKTLDAGFRRGDSFLRVHQF